MYIDLIILIILIIAVVAYFRNFLSFIYLIVSVDILYKLLHFIANNVDIEELTVLIYKYIPNSVAGLIGKYIGTSNIFYTIVLWIIFLIYCIFLSRIIRNLMKKKV